MLADVDCKDEAGWTPLHLAAQENSIDVSKVPTYQ